MGDDTPRVAADPKVLDWRLGRVEDRLEHVETQINGVNVSIGVHGERMKAVGEKLTELQNGSTAANSKLDRIESQSARSETNRLWQLIMAAVTIVGAVIGSHFLIK